jgi:hypothetical protein
MTRSRISILIGVAALAAAGLGAGIGIAVTAGPGAPATPATASAWPGSPSYSYYRSMMSSYLGGSSMMGGPGSYQWMMGASGYQWMFGGTTAPAWMRDAQLPASMMGTGTDPGQILGQLRANAPGPRGQPRPGSPARQPGPCRRPHQPGGQDHHLHHRHRAPGRAGK